MGMAVCLMIFGEKNPELQILLVLIYCYTRILNICVCVMFTFDSLYWLLLYFRTYQRKFV